MISLHHILFVVEVICLVENVIVGLQVKPIQLHGRIIILNLVLHHKGHVAECKVQTPLKQIPVIVPSIHMDTSVLAYLLTSYLV